MEIDEIKEYLGELGYEVLNLEKIWRHYTGHLKKEDKDYFFKMASTIEISPKTKNEADWNKRVTNKLSVKVPQIFQEAELYGLYWFIAEFVPGDTLASAEHPDQTQKLEDNLEIIAKTALEIMNLKFEGNNLEFDQLEFNQKLDEWTLKSERDLSRLRQFLEDRIEFLQLFPSHGDYVPWSFRLKESGELYLVDSEHAKWNYLKFYDVAYFYHRVNTKLKNPEIANRFLEAFKNIYDFSENDKKCFELALAQRLIGGNMDAKFDNLTSIELQDDLQNKLLAGEIL